MIDTSLPPLISHESIVALIEFLKVGGLPALFGLVLIIMAGTGNWPWKRSKM